MVCSAERGGTRAAAHRALRGAVADHTTATAKLLVKVLLEGLAQQVKGKRVETRVGEGEDTRHDTAHEMNQRSVHLMGGKREWIFKRK